MSIAILLGPMIYQYIFLSRFPKAAKVKPQLAAHVVAGFWKAAAMRR
jgi:hypothetical protein